VSTIEIEDSSINHLNVYLYTTLYEGIFLNDTILMGIPFIIKRLKEKEE